MVLDYQGVLYDDLEINLTVKYSGLCDNYLVEFFAIDEILASSNFIQKSLTFPANSPIISIGREEFTNRQNQTTFIRILAMDNNGLICSDPHSLHTYYRFLQTGPFLVKTFRGPFL